MRVERHSVLREQGAEFAEVLDCLKQLEKEKKASDKEMESVREKLREIQSVRI